MEQPVYNEDNIKTLSSLEHIRLRPGMYIGRRGDGSHPDDGIYILLKEVIDNAVDEYIMGSGKRIDIRLEGKQLSVRDYGRGIPLGKLVQCVSEMNTGGKYNDAAFQFSIGLNGVGTKAVNALSREFIARSVRDGKFKEARFERGILTGENDGDTDEKNGTTVRFTPDEEQFVDFEYRLEYIEKRLWMYAYLNSGLSLYLNDQRFFSKNGLKDLLDTEMGDSQLYDVMAFKVGPYEFALSHHDDYGETYYSFVNGQYTSDGGTHLSAFREGVLKAINEFSGKSFQASDVRDGLTGAIAIKLQDPVFESQTKNKLGNSEVRGPIVAAVKDAICDYLHKNRDAADIVMDKISRNEQLRKQIQQVKKQNKESAKKMSLKIPKLKDCKYHKGDRRANGRETMIFITEGQSATGSMVSCRDVYTQAIFSLKGKPLNCHNEAEEKVYRNEELYYITQALGIDNDPEELRYDKVVLATDADVDGSHIRNLMITFFLELHHQVVTSGHLYILETPIFRVRNKQETIYCYNLVERDAAIQRLGKGRSMPEITRFKGLGEISPDEFGVFIGENIRLLQVTVDTMRNVPELLNFYMGENTPARREHIMKNLDATL